MQQAAEAVVAGEVAPPCLDVTLALRYMTQNSRITFHQVPRMPLLLFVLLLLLLFALQLRGCCLQLRGCCLLLLCCCCCYFGCCCCGLLLLC